MSTAVERFVRAPYNTMPETKMISWTDDFFEQPNSDGNIEEVVAVFDFDNTASVDYQSKSNALCLVWLAMMPFPVTALYGTVIGLNMQSAPIGVCVALSCPGLCLTIEAVKLTPCLLRRQAQWYSYARHLAVTMDGIQFVVDKHQQCWGWPMCDRGRTTKTILFDHITNCDIIEPAGNECYCIPLVLMTIRIDTMSSKSEGHALSITGIKEPHKFKALVLAMKRNRGSCHPPAPKIIEMTER